MQIRDSGEITRALQYPEADILFFTVRAAKAVNNNLITTMFFGAG